ncbi:MAG: prenyltransferase/squalene oxidase repeat-containing protein [archaeon]|nr:prenyltransferase/squalene oxidase repeat-containing protein [archaeon]
MISKNFLIVISLLLIVSGAMAFPLSSSDPQIQTALDYLSDQQSQTGDIGGFATSSWAVMAIESAGEDSVTFGSPSVMDFLRNNSNQLQNSTDFSRYILSLTAAEQNPYSFNGTNFVSAQENFFDGTQFGDITLLNDDIFAILALKSAGKANDYPKIVSAKNFLLSNQEQDGGFAFALTFGSDPDTTAAAIMALVSAGESSSSSAIQNARNYLKSMQGDNAGFESFGTENSNTTAWAIMALVSMNESPEDAFWDVNGASADDFLLTLQDASGGFKWINSSQPDIYSTSYAIISLVGETLPVNSVLEVPDENDSDALSIFVRIEGVNETVFEDTVTLPESINFTATNSGTPYTLTQPSALMALLQAAQDEGFAVSVSDAYYPGFGFFVDSIDNIDNQGFNGWSYAVDYVGGQVSADNFEIDEDNQEIIWFYSTSFDMKLLKLSLSNSQIDEGTPVNASVDYFDEATQQWLDASNSVIKILGRNETYNTDLNGNAIITPAFSGNYKLFAEKDNFVRSADVSLLIGSGSPDIPPQSSIVELRAFIVPAVSITVDPSLLDFGKVGAGYSINGPALNITNAGSHNIRVTADVVGTVFIQSLKLNNVLWNVFEILINADPIDFINVVPVGSQLDVPEDIDVSGEQTGSITFWAESTGSPI